MAKCEKILIAGFSGSGKTSFLQELESTAPDSGWVFDDLDQIIVQRHKNEIPQLIEDHGWDKFRLWERQELESWLKDDGCGVLSLGGGALSQIVLDIYGVSRKIKMLYLETPFEDCWERLNLPGAEIRPMVKLGKGELHRVYEERVKIYSQIPWKLKNPRGQDLRTLAHEFWESYHNS
jgi:shikimate kinase